MANFKINGTLRNNMLAEWITFLGTSAKLKIFSGVQPAGGGAETTKLAELICDVTAFAPTPTGGVLTLNPITADSAADASGTASWFRCESSGGTWGFDGDVSVTGGGGDLQLDDVAIVINANVALGGPNVITAPNAA